MRGKNARTLRLDWTGPDDKRDDRTAFAKTKNRKRRGVCCTEDDADQTVVNEYNIGCPRIISKIFMVKQRVQMIK